MRISLLLILILCGLSTFAQKKNIQYDLSSISVLGTGNMTAFWGVSNKYGTISIEPNSALLQTKLFTEFDTARNKKLDYALGLDVINRLDNKYELFFHQYYLKIKYRFITLQAGRMEEYIGNQDSTLSSGGLLWSSNAPPMPKVTAGIINYTPVPFTKGYLEIKGALTHGWFEKDAYVKHEWLHHKYIYIRAGGKLPVKAHFGFQHFVQWGGTSPEAGKLPSSFNTYKVIFFATQYDSSHIPFGTPLGPEYSNRIGNHIGSRHFGLDVDLKPVSISLYYQTIFEDASGLKWHNKQDGFWGLSLKFRKINWLSGLVYEFLNTNDQSMSYAPDKAANGPDNYFNHYIYRNGWSYDNYTIGTPLITSPELLKQMNIPDYSWYDYLRNNRVLAHHLGLKGIVYDTDYRLLITYTKNKGTYSYPFNYTKKSVSTYLELRKQLKWFSNFEVSLAIATDFGKMYTNKSSFLFTLRKTGKLF